jgi:hypothetical protein
MHCKNGRRCHKNTTTSNEADADADAACQVYSPESRGVIPPSDKEGGSSFPDGDNGC